VSDSAPKPTPPVTSAPATPGEVPPLKPGETAAGATGVPKPKKKKKKLPPKKIPFRIVVLNKTKLFIKEHVVPLGRELFSVDKPTRRMTFFFLFCVAGFIGLMSTVFFNCGSSRLLKVWGKSQESAREQKELLHRQREKADQEASWLALDKFSFDLKPAPGDRKGPRLAEFDISVQGDSPETRNYLEENMVQARNAIFKSLVGWDRETLMSVEGKKKLRQNISDSLNTWLPEGKVLDLYFTKFLFK
jgi:flagellar basal body-associated protein FliL